MQLAISCSAPPLIATAQPEVRAGCFPFAAFLAAFSTALSVVLALLRSFLAFLDLIEAALGGGRKVKPDVKPSDLAAPALSEALLDSIAKTGTSERATRRSRTGDLLITNQLLYQLS